MLKVVNFFRGYLVVRVSGPFPERFLNICAENGVAFWRLGRTAEGDFIARVRPKGLASLRALAERALCTVRVERSVGAPFFLLRFRERYAFVAGMLICIAAIWTMSLRVWEFEVHGCEMLDESAVLAALEELGVGVGTLRSDIDPDLLETQMLLRLDELRWFTVNVSGSRASVEVRERVDAPELLDRSEPMNVVARRSGLIEKVVVLEGKAQVEAGATVEEGQLLVSGVLDMYNDELQRSYGVSLVSARAEVTARTWYTFEAKTPLFASEKLYSGVTSENFALIAGKKRINLSPNSRISHSECDKIIERTRLTLPGGFDLPLVVEKTSLREYAPVEAARDRAVLEAELQTELLARLDAETGGAEVVSTAFEFYEADGCLCAVLTAECREDIALGVEIPAAAGQNFSEETE